jgi:hypothetical protein
LSADTRAHRSSDSVPASACLSCAIALLRASLRFFFLNFFFFLKPMESASRLIALLQKNIDLFWNHPHSKFITVPLFASFGSAMAAVRDWL